MKEEEYFIIPTSWFSEWVKTGGKVGPIDTTELLCSHSKLNPLHVSKMKRISKVS